MRKKNKKDGEDVRLYAVNKELNLSGKRIREARLKLGLSQEALAAQLQLHGLQLGQIAVSKIENGKRVVFDYEIPVFAEVLNVTNDFLLERDALDT